MVTRSAPHGSAARVAQPYLKVGWLSRVLAIFKLLLEGFPTEYLKSKQRRMDPASVIGVIGVVTQITQAIYTYGDAVKDCKSEVAQLRCELFGMHAALTQMDQDLKLAHGSSSTYSVVSPNLHSPQCQEMLNETRRVLEKLANTLTTGSSRPERLTKQLLWPLKRPQVQALAKHLERLKTFFILTVTQDSLQAAQDIQYSVDEISKTVQEVLQKQDEDSVYLDAMNWLAPYDPNRAHATASSSRLTGTNSWFLDEIFQDWVAGAGSVLWLNGKPGSGKTCLISACADRLVQTNCVVSYFYCSYNDLSSQEPRNILGSLIAQLCLQRATARHIALEAYQESKARNSLHEICQIPVLISLMKRIMPKLSTQAFFFVDAADECGDSLRTALEALFQLVNGTARRARLMISSTENVTPTIRESISSHNISASEVNLGIARVSSDINAYITARFARESRLKQLRHDLRISLIEKLQSQHQGSFRWTSCTIDELLRATPRAIKTALDGVASTLGDIYMEILRNIPSDMVGFAKSMLQYLVSAMRPLTLDELGEVASLVFTSDFEEDDRLIEPEAIVYSLHSLVHCDASNQRIELAHSSVRTFLTNPELSGAFYTDPAVANATISKACLYYLALPPFQQTCPDEAALGARKRAWPFFEYAACFWTRHARAMVSPLSDNDKQFLALFASFADSAGHFSAWYQCVYPQGGPSIWNTQPLYMCAREGLAGPLQVLLVRCSREELEQRGGARGSTALHVAATYGEVEAVRLLLAAGADPNERNAVGESGIQWAAFWSHGETVRVLLEAGASPDLLNYDANSGIYDHMLLHCQTSIPRHTGTEGDSGFDLRELRSRLGSYSKL